MVDICLNVLGGGGCAVSMLRCSLPTVSLFIMVGFVPWGLVLCHSQR